MEANMDSSFKIGKRIFFTAMIILLLLMIAAGIMTRIVPTGSYERYVLDGRLTIDPASFHYTDVELYPVWRWFTAPIEVLWSDDGLMVIAIILFILIIGGSISVLNESHLLHYVLAKMVKRYSSRKYGLMAIIVLVFMLFGAFMGIFEEIIPLIPFVIALSYSLGWDAVTGLAMSLLAAGFGFSAAIANPFSVGVAQRLSDLPLFSGAWYRGITFVVIYAILLLFIRRYALRMDDKNKDLFNRLNEGKIEEKSFNLPEESPALNRAYRFFIILILLLVLLLVSTVFIKGISDYLLPLIGLLFLIAGIGSSLLAGMSLRHIFKTFGNGILGIAPGIVLILMATSVKYIIFQAGIMDTILFSASNWIADSSPFTAIMSVYLLVLFLNFFIGSATAKAFLVMPIIIPLADLIGLNRQLMVLAFAFGDGFSNVLYPTNAVLLIGLGLANINYTTWFKWVIKLQVIIFIITSILLWIAYMLDYGPY